MLQIDNHTYSSKCLESRHSICFPEKAELFIAPTSGSIHYANMSVQYSAIFHGCKNDNFQMKMFDIFLIFAQKIDCGYTLEPPQRGGSNEYPQSLFWSKNKKNMYTRVNPTFSI